MSRFVLSMRALLLCALLAALAWPSSADHTLPARPHRVVASWYGWESGDWTANGERFDPRKLTAAHRTLPFGTILRVTNPDNGLVVMVRVNDRGPYVRGRHLDLSRAAADAIGMRRRGVAPVLIEVI